MSFDFRKRNLFLLSRNPLGTLNLRTACETYQLSLLVRVSGFRIGSDRIVIIVLLFVYYEKTRDHKRGGIFFFFLIIPDFVRFPRTLTISCFRFSENSWLLSFEIRLFVQKSFLSISATSPDLARGSFLNIFSSSVTRLVSSDPWIVYTRNGFVRAAFSLSSVLLHHRIPDREELLWMRIETDDIDPLCRVRVRCARARSNPSNLSASRPPRDVYRENVIWKPRADTPGGNNNWAPERRRTTRERDGDGDGRKKK